MQDLFKQMEKDYKSFKGKEVKEEKPPSLTLSDSDDDVIMEPTPKKEPRARAQPPKQSPKAGPKMAEAKAQKPKDGPEKKLGTGRPTGSSKDLLEKRLSQKIPAEPAVKIPLIKKRPVATEPPLAAPQPSAAPPPKPAVATTTAAVGSDDSDDTPSPINLLELVPSAGTTTKQDRNGH